MKTRKNDLVEYVILGTLGTLVVLTLVIPQLLRDRGEPQLLFLSVLFRDTDNTNWTVTRQGMEQAADELGAELRFLTLTVQGDGREQAELLRREVEGGAGALVVVPADPEALGETLAQQQSGCPVVALESPVAGAVGTAAPDNALLGRQLAQALLEDWDGGPVLLLDSASASSGVTARLEAAQETLDGAGVPNIRVSALPEGRVSERWVMAFEPSATRQAADKKEAEGQSYALYGTGSSTAITVQLERGTIQAVAAWSDYAAGYLAVRQAVQAVRERPGELEPLAFSIVRGEDIYEPENQKLLFPVTS